MGCVKVRSGWVCCCEEKKKEKKKEQKGTRGSLITPLGFSSFHSNFKGGKNKPKTKVMGRRTH
jgi:hypothetical protein